jgi:hypothetical protein
MRAVRASVTALTFAAIAIAPHIAAADKAVEHTYEIENLDAYPQHVFVAWPRTCGSTGDPLGTVSLQLNPDWVSRQHEVDYEVLEKGKRHEISPYCLSSMRIHALPAAAFPRGSRVATVDDSALGKKPGETYATLPALDEIDLPKRIPFFASDPRRVSSPFRFDAPATVLPPAGPPKAVHHVLAIEGVTAAFGVQPKRAIYTYDEGPPQTVSYPVDAGTMDAGATASAAPTPPPRDLGTRWVYAAALGGLIAGGIIAHYRKKRAAAPK